MQLLYIDTQKTFEAEIMELRPKDYITIEASKQFIFDWSKEKCYNVFKIVPAGIKKTPILGLIALVYIPEEFRIHINLIEVSNENKGKGKKVDCIAGCLLAFTAQLAFEKGYLGFVSLVPKTSLINLYVSKYGFAQYGQQLAIEQQTAIKLIQKYL